MKLDVMTITVILFLNSFFLFYVYIDYLLTYSPTCGIVII